MFEKAVNCISSDNKTIEFVYYLYTTLLENKTSKDLGPTTYEYNVVKIYLFVFIFLYLFFIP